MFNKKFTGIIIAVVLSVSVLVFLLSALPLSGDKNKQTTAEMPATEEVEGVITEIGDNKVMIKDEEGIVTTVTFDKNTVFKREVISDATAQDLVVGHEVEVNAVINEGNINAQSVEIEDIGNE